MYLGVDRPKIQKNKWKKEINVNIRIISSTSKNLLELVNLGKFREDLFHRLNVMPIELNSLKKKELKIYLF